MVAGLRIARESRVLMQEVGETSVGLTISAESAGKMSDYTEFERPGAVVIAYSLVEINGRSWGTWYILDTRKAMGNK